MSTPAPNTPRAGTERISPETLDKMDNCRWLLPEPGPEVVGELIAEIRLMRIDLAALAQLEQENRELRTGLEFVRNAYEAAWAKPEHRDRWMSEAIAKANTLLAASEQPPTTVPGDADKGKETK